MSSTVITGAGLLAGLGAELSGALDRLAHAGEPALGPIAMDPDALFGERNYRPLDRTGRLAVAAAGSALADAGLHKDLTEDLEQLGLVLGTMFGSVETIAGFDRRVLEHGPIYARPMEFANSVINAAAGQVAIWYGMGGMNTTVSCGTVSSLQALGMASDALADGRARFLLAGGADEHSAIVQSAVPTEESGVLSALPAELGEAACLFVLENADSAAQRGALPRLAILGWACGHLPFRAADAEGHALATATSVLRRALEDAAIEPDQLVLASVSALDPQASGLERAALDAVCGKALPRFSVKARSGECLGASGALQVLPALALAGGRLLLLGGEEHPRTVDPGPVLLTAIDPHGPIAALVVAPFAGKHR